jgi:glucoamylase
VWAHAEYAKLVRSLHDGRVFDMPQQPYERYVRSKHVATVSVWSAQNRWRTVCEGCTLRIQTPGSTTILWSLGDGAAQQEIVSRDTTLPGVWIADVESATLPAGSVIRFAIRTADGVTDAGHTISVVARTAG